MRCLLSKLVAAVSLALTSITTLAQYPTKPVRLVVAFAAGGPSDTAARTLGQALSKPTGQPFIIENRPGADGAIAPQTVLSATADGYTLLFGGTTTVPISLMKNPPPFDVLTDFAPVSTVTRFAWSMYLPPDATAKSVAEFVTHAKANPGKLNFASSNYGEFLAAAQFMNATGTSMVRVPYKGAAQALPDLMAGRVQLNFAPLSAGLPYVRDGRLRMLAILLPKRSPAVPDVPTMSEAGVLGISVPSWQGVLAPVKTPGKIVELLSREINRVLLDPEVRAQFDRQGVQAEASTPQALAATLREDAQTWRQFIRQNGLDRQ